MSYQAEAIARMPADELVAVLIKAQHNVVSERRSYAHMAMPRIQHEYILLWRKRERRVFELLRGIAGQAHDRLRNTWCSIVHMALVSLGGEAPLPKLYEAVQRAAPDRCETNANFQAKVRQVLQMHPDCFASAARGVWGLAPSSTVDQRLAA